LNYVTRLANGSVLAIAKPPVIMDVKGIKVFICGFQSMFWVL